HNTYSVILFLYIYRSHPKAPLFPYTTLFRSRGTAVPSVLDLEVKGQYRQEERFNGALKERMWPITASAWLTPLRVVYAGAGVGRSEEHTSELQSLRHLVCRLLLEKKKYTPKT